MRRVPILAALVVPITLWACDSSSGDGTPAFPCRDGVSSFQPCGGDPTGRWVLDSVCVSGPALFANTTMMRDCPQVQVAVDMDWQGTLEFADGQVAFRLTGMTSDTTLTIPGSCLQQVPCGEAVQEPGYACAMAGDACVCRQSVQGGPQPEDDTPFEVDGTDLVTSHDGETTRMPFCVKGDWMALQIFVGDDAPEGEYGGSRVPAILTLRRD